jgi:predicted ATP-grasp superfamily ATP-dependent carboligase
VRALGRAGVEVWLAGADRNSPASRSRFVRRTLRLPLPRKVDAYHAALLSATDREARQLLLYASNFWTAHAVAHCDPDLPTNVIHHLPAFDLARSCLSPVRFAHLCENRGLPAPETRICEDASEVAVARVEFGGRVILKLEAPTESSSAGEDAPTPADRELAHLLEPDRELPHSVVIALERGVPCVIQRFIPGPQRSTVHVQAYRGIGDAKMRTFVGQWLRTMPGDPHREILVRSRWAPSASRLTGEVLEALDYRGFAGVELRRHLRSGRFKVVSLRPYFGPSCGLPERAGLNLPALAYLDHHGLLEEVPGVMQTEGLHWWDVSGALRGLGALGTAWRSRVELLAPPAGRTVFARFSADDPHPGVAFLRRRSGEIGSGAS